MIAREKREGKGKRVLEIDAEGLRAIACAGTESSSHAPYVDVALPPGLMFDVVRMVTSGVAKPKPKHQCIPGSVLGQPEQEVLK